MTLTRPAPDPEQTPDPGVRPEVPRSFPRSKRHRRGWIGEVLAMSACYWLYETGRTFVAGGTAAAFRNAKDLVAAERFLGIYWERPLQEAFLRYDWFITFWNIYYGTIHFVLPVVALVALYKWHPVRYLRWRNTLLAMWTIAVITFIFYPVMPPRLMPPSYGFVDTAADYFNYGPQVKVDIGRDGLPTERALAQYGNPYAAMPSFHIGWSTFSVLALWPLVRRRWLRALLVLYPLTVLFCITVTANHWLVDAIGGLAILGLGYATAVAIEWAGKTARRGVTARDADLGASVGA